MKRAFEFWLVTEQGQKCNSRLTEPQQPYLMNRLYWAYHAGLEQAGMNYENEELRKEHRNLMSKLAAAEKELRNAKTLINKATMKQISKKKQSPSE